MGEAAREHVLETYSWAAVAERFEAAVGMTPPAGPRSAGE